MGLHILPGKTVNQVDQMGTLGGPLNTLTGTLPANTPGTSFSGTGSWTVGTVASGAVATTTVAVPGSRVGDKVQLSFSPALPNDFTASGYVSVAGTVTITTQNNQSGSVAAGSTTLIVSVLPQGQVVRNDGAE